MRGRGEEEIGASLPSKDPGSVHRDRDWGYIVLGSSQEVSLNLAESILDYIMSL